MKKHLPLILAVAVALLVYFSLQNGCGNFGLIQIGHGKAFTPSGPVTVEQREIGGFTKIHVSSALTVELKNSDTNSLRVETHEDLIPKVITEIRGDTLHIHMVSGLRYRNVRKLSVTVNSQNVPEEVSVSGASRFTCENTISTETLVLKCNGASRLRMKNIESKNLGIEIQGASSIDIAGKVESATIQTSGASKLNASQLEIEKCDVNVSGASKVTCGNIGKELSARANGASKLYYQGNPEIRVREAHGASKILGP